MLKKLTRNQQNLLIDIKNKSYIQFYLFNVNNEYCSKNKQDIELLESLGYIKIEKQYNHKNNLSLEDKIWKITITNKAKNLYFQSYDLNKYLDSKFYLIKELDNQKSNKKAS